MNVSSMGHKWTSKFDVNDLTNNNPYSPAQAYFVSKLCNVLFTRELADRLKGTGEFGLRVHACQFSITRYFHD